MPHAITDRVPSCTAIQYLIFEVSLTGDVQDARSIGQWIEKRGGKLSNHSIWQSAGRMAMNGWLEKVGRGRFKITEAGKQQFTTAREFYRHPLAN